MSKGIKIVPGAGATIVYDGQCPFCSAYTRLTLIKESLGSIELVDARKSLEWRERLAKEGLDINEGFAIAHGGRMFHGAEALEFIANVEQRSTLFGRVTSALFYSNTAARAAYPVLRAGRNLTLRILGRQKMT